MSVINLNKLFPAADDGSQGPLPKQQQFLNLMTDPNGPSNIAYFGGYGSGKSLILVVSQLTLGIIYGGEYVIARQFMPELRRTTMRLFHELCPPELIIEKKDAVAETVIKSANGTARFYFVALDEPEKLDSLNLDGAGIDEASQTTEEAFLKLQGRLRGKKGLRKLVAVGNPKGHNYVFKYFVSKTVFKEYTSPITKKLITVEDQKKDYHLIQAPSTENKHLPAGYLEKMLSTYSKERIKRDIEGSFDSFEGQVYSEFDRAIHVVRPFRIPSNWKRHLRLDGGFRNPAAVLFAAISPDGDVYVYKELYQREWLVKEIVLGDSKSTPKKIGLVDMIKGAGSFETAKIDPATKQRRGQTGESDYDEYRRHWPDSLPVLQLAKNAVEMGIDRVKQYLKPHPKTGKPSLYVFETCTNILEEITTYQYPDLKPNEQGMKAEKEAPRKVDDHLLDCLRYLILDLPTPYALDVEEIDRHKKYSRIEIMMQDEIASFKKPKERPDPFEDGI